jgi:starvation-inducible DNA-binding protein
MQTSTTVEAQKSSANAMDAKRIGEILDSVFGSVYDLYWKTHSCHWNVVAKDFYGLHMMLEEQYKTLWASLDEIAERYRVFELNAPTKSNSSDASFSTAGREEMLSKLLMTHEATIAVLRDAIDGLSEAGDEAGADMITGMLAEHEKMAWMIRSSV